MTPIISPWIIYVLHLADAVSVLAGMTLFGCVFHLIIIGGDCDCDERTIRRWLFIGAIVVIVLLPSRKDMIAMIALSYITPDNIALVQSNIVDFVQQIVSAVNNSK